MLPLIALMLHQAVVSQGQPDKPAFEYVMFDSPMVLDLSLIGIPELPPRVAKKYPEVRNGVCDDVSFTFLEVLFRRTAHESGITLEVRGALWVRPSYDRDVDLRFEIVRGKTILIREVLKHLDAEEGYALEFKKHLSLSPEIVSAIKGGPNAPHLRITVYVREG